MANYIICTDSACDIHPDTLASWGVPCVKLTYHFEGEDKEYTDEDLPVKDFYDRMRSGSVSKTAAANPDTMKELFRKYLAQGLDILYLGFSSGLSTTYNSARLAAEELAEEYPNRAILTVDTLCASAGQGLFLYLTVKEKEKGATLEEAASFAENLVPQLCHWFTVDDLVYLKRGGRISPTLAFVGNVLNLKPVLHVDDEGHLISKMKVRGRKPALKALVDKYGELATDTANNTIFISQADCMEDAQYVERLLSERYGIKVEHITDISPIIGSHSGPGTLALFFVAKNR